MANSIYSTDQQVWHDIIEENWGTIASLIAARTRNASQLEVVSTLTDFHTLLVNYSHGGVSKIQRTSVETIVKELDTDIEQLISRVEAFLAQAQEDERVRVNQEAVRVTDEEARERHETTRESQETDRVTAENARVSQWTSFFTNGVAVDWPIWYAAVVAEWASLKGDAQDATSAANSAASNANTKASLADEKAALANTKAGLADDKATLAQQKAELADQMATEASRVNATITGMTVTITNRQGTASSVNIGFEIAPENVYSSVAAMEDDAANVLPGKFCMIATTDPTSADNAQLWGRNSSAATSEHPFTFLSDLDQASSAAWADWLENMKPAINERIATADADHARAETDHTRADADHTASLTQTNRAKAFNDHPWEIRQDGYIWVWDETHDNGDGSYGAMVRTNKMIIDFNDLTEAQRQQMIQDFYNSLVFASEQTCEDIITELF